MLGSVMLCCGLLSQVVVIKNSDCVMAAALHTTIVDLVVHILGGRLGLGRYLVRTLAIKQHHDVAAGDHFRPPESIAMSVALVYKIERQQSAVDLQLEYTYRSQRDVSR